MAIVRLTSFVCGGGKGNGVNNEKIFIDYCKRMAILCTAMYGYPVGAVIICSEPIEF